MDTSGKGGAGRPASAMRRSDAGSGAKRLGLLFLAALVVAALLLAVAACGNNGATVTMKELAFEPSTVTIKQGQTVTFNNEDRRDRQVMSGHPPIMTDDFMSPVLKTGDSWSFTFDKAGEYPYHDMMIPGLLGSVVVEE